MKFFERWSQPKETHEQVAEKKKEMLREKLETLEKERESLITWMQHDAVPADRNRLDAIEKQIEGVKKELSELENAPKGVNA